MDEFLTDKSVNDTDSGNAVTESQNKRRRIKENIFWFMAGAITITLLGYLTILLSLDHSTLLKLIERLVK